MEPYLLAAILSLWGLMNGVVTCKVGVRPRYEFPFWVVGYVTWFLVLGDDATPLILFMTSALSGVWNGAAQAVLLEDYKVNNPWTAKQFDEMGDDARRNVVGFSVVIGLFFGGVLAGVSWGLSFI